MKDFALEDMTKPELIKVIKQSQAYQPTQRILQWIRWESMCKQAQTVMSEAIKEQRLNAHNKDLDSHSRWMKASEKFDHGMKLSDKAETFLEEIKAGREGK